jgi:hypothetical protein
MIKIVTVSFKLRDGTETSTWHRLLAEINARYGEVTGMHISEA